MADLTALVRAMTDAMRRSGQSVKHAWCADCGAWPGKGVGCDTCAKLAAEFGRRAEVDGG